MIYHDIDLESLHQQFEDQIRVLKQENSSLKESLNLIFNPREFYDFDKKHCPKCGSGRHYREVLLLNKEETDTYTGWEIERKFIPSKKKFWSGKIIPEHFLVRCSSCKITWKEKTKEQSIKEKKETTTNG